ncbi:Hypothetical protein CINCED_3A011380 [Cinara cedri]|uniref:Uncharacterized protein n=1 Tax=Cinara cedri TaxID=506608 RepID=A0A5E4MYB0_9HEMI|nr:Hypothetical protein CINCED_3A011380 [Cinara cedri]
MKVRGSRINKMSKDKGRKDSFLGMTEEKEYTLEEELKKRQLVYGVTDLRIRKEAKDLERPCKWISGPARLKITRISREIQYVSRNLGGTSMTEIYIEREKGKKNAIIKLRAGGFELRNKNGFGKNEILKLRSEPGRKSSKATSNPRDERENKCLYPEKHDNSKESLLRKILLFEVLKY